MPEHTKKFLLKWRRMETQILSHGTELEYWKDRATQLWAKNTCLAAEISWLEGEKVCLHAGNTAFAAQIQELEKKPR
jgi:hypothetical protein